MDSIDSGKAGFIYQQPVHTMLSHPVVADSKAERIESSLESSSKTKEYSLDEWEQQRGHITNLYAAQEKTLPQVADLMEYKYGFIASQRQYKRRFAKWGLDTKNIRDHDMRLALAKDLKRKREGKDTEFEINGRLLPRQKMQRFMVRKELSEEDVIRSDAPTPPYVTYHTPRLVQDDDVTNTLASISVGKDEVMTDTCSTHDEETEILFDQSKIIQPNKRPTSVYFFLQVRKLMFKCKKQDSATLHKINPNWRSYFIRRLNYYARCRATGAEHRSFQPDFINSGFEALEAHWILDAESGAFDPLNFTELLPSSTTGGFSLPPIATNKHSDHDKLLRKAHSNSSVSRSESILCNICEKPFHELQRIPTASPFERWSQRYDISSSPNWIKSYMSPSNPLLLLTPATIGTPWDHPLKTSPHSTGSQGYGFKVYDYSPYSHDSLCDNYDPLDPLFD